MRSQAPCHLTLRDKGASYKHRWVPGCSACGWVGVAALKAFARRQYRLHREAMVSERRRPQGHQRPRPCTPRADLPALLR